MAYTIVDYDLAHRLELSTNELSMLEMIRGLEDPSNGGWCWASKSYFSTIFRLSTKQIQRYRKRLGDLGFLEFGEGAKVKTTAKYFSERQGKFKPNNKGDLDVPPLDISNPEGGHLGAKEGTRMSPNNNIYNINNKEEAHILESPDLFGVKKEKKDSSARPKKICLAESNIGTFEQFETEFKDIKATVDLDYYFNAAENYSNQGNKYVDWKSAIGVWMMRDNAEGKLKKLSTQDDKEMLKEYLKM